MNVHEFLETYGWAELEKVGKKAGTTRGYLSHVAHGRRRTSVEFADRLVAASGGRMSFMALMRSPVNAEQKKGKKGRRAA